MRIRYFFFILVSFAFGFSFSSCFKKEDSSFTRSDSLRFVKEDLAKYMYNRYLWYNNIPQGLNLDDFETPDKLLEAMLYRKTNAKTGKLELFDKWSYVTTKAEHDKYYNEGKYYGFGFRMGWTTTKELKIMFLYKESDLYKAGVRRSWKITAINGTPITPSSKPQDMLGPNREGVKILFSFIDNLGQQKTISATKKEISIKPVVYDTVFTVNGKKTGYFVFNNFIEPAIADLNKVFATFKKEQVEELICDLRYNGGGMLGVGELLGGLIGGEKLNGKALGKLLHNDISKGLDENYLFPPSENSINVKRVIFLTTEQTASASEFVRNGLKAYPEEIETVLIGTSTHGKPVGMESKESYGYVFIPITFQLVNAKGKGGYFNGLTVDSFVIDDYNADFGSPEEAGLKEAIQYIKTGAFSSIALKSSHSKKEMLLNGFQREIGAF